MRNLTYDERRLLAALALTWVALVCLVRLSNWLAGSLR
jgi:hypothetical protein